MMETDTAFEVYFTVALRWWALSEVIVLLTRSELWAF